MIVEDNGVGDVSNVLGSVAYSGNVDSYFVPFATRLTEPILGSNVSPSVDLASIQVGGGANNSSIVIEFSDTDFFASGPTIDLPSLIGGTTNGTIQYQTFGSLSNDLFETDILIFDSGFPGPRAFSFTDFATIALAGTYSLTAVVTITHDAAVTNSSFNATIEISEPVLIPLTTLSGLLFIAGFAARRRQRRH